MNLLDHFSKLIKIHDLSIGIGLGKEHFHNQKIIEASVEFLKDKHLKITFYGDNNCVDDINIIEKHPNLYLRASNDPESCIIDSLMSDEIMAAIRGSLSSSKFLLKIRKKMELDSFTRIALLETYEGHQFFYGPVGIDECNTFQDKVDFIINSFKIFEIIGLNPKISILSGGRIGDIGRDPHIDQTIREAEDVVHFFKEKYPELQVSHEEILIENAINRKANLIIAPDGVSGNLIYRTLVHLGAGKAYGAVYSNIYNKINKIILDTSRVGKASEIIGSLILSSSLASMIDKD